MKLILKKHGWLKRLKLFPRRLIYHPAFFALTVFGNTLIISGAVSFYLIEGGTNPNVQSMLDSFLWAVSTVTTVGGNIVPQTGAGKIVSIILMVLGTATFWSYTALFAEALLMSDIKEIE